jgi:hypothetical protein
MTRITTATARAASVVAAVLAATFGGLATAQARPVSPPMDTSLWIWALVAVVAAVVLSFAFRGMMRRRGPASPTPRQP